MIRAFHPGMLSLFGNSFYKGPGLGVRDALDQRDVQKSFGVIEACHGRIALLGMFLGHCDLDLVARSGHTRLDPTHDLGSPASFASPE